MSAIKGLGNRQAVEKLKGKADARARDILPIIADIQAKGMTSLRVIAAELNARGILTARGGQWHATTVANVLQRAAPAAS